ncbi:host specificity protein J [Pusillimonas sp. NJUB218]|uniref:host specificity protein J n=1 Tax=Pusillimonas sp. NJUB218 TaxID=2023230 RepID=UPI001F4886E8|nr:host specificity factor TipJ family phage tail protein [Pusillimonas sp. NJUB218]
MDLIKHATPLVVLPNPLIPEGKRTYVAEFLPGETLGAYIQRNSVGLPRSKFRVWHNARPVPMHLWDRLIPRTGDQLMIQAVAEGGGGGGGKILRTVAMIALVIAAPHIAGLLNTSLGLGFAAGSIGMGVLTAGVMIGGSLLINALLPPPKATLPQLTSGGKYETSPTYAIAGGRNRPRLWEPMPIIFGRHKVVPDLAANYYTEYVGEDQYLNQAFHFGLQAGELDLIDFKIGNTPIGNYQGVQLQVSGADGSLTLFPGNVDTLQGFTLQSGVVNSRTTAKDVTYLAVELAAQLFYIRDDGGIDARTTQVRIQYRPVGGTWTDIGLLQDAIYATHYWSLEVTVYPEYALSYTAQVGFGSTNYADHYEGQQGFIDYDNWGNARYGTWRWKPHPYRLGQPWQGYAPDPLIGYSSAPGVRLTGARQEPTRQTVGWSVAKGQYEIRVWKESGDIKSSRESNETAVNQILAYQADEASYLSQQRVALRIKATSQLNGAVDEFNAVALAKTQVWNGSAWVVEHTRNPAWWYLHFARGKKISGKRLYGAGLLDAQIDIDRIKAWALFCQEKSLTFDYVLDRKVSTAEVLQTIARAGRASPTWQTGKLGIIWDAANLPVTAMFGPFNIKAGTFKVDYINEGNVDEVIVNFSNAVRDYEMDEVRVMVPGATSATNPLQLDLEGCTNPDMAGREANLIAASQVWHRRRTSWETDIEGWVANRGDVVQISHDLTVWGYSGRLLGRVGNVITLDKHVPSGGTGTLMIRDPEGAMRVVSVVSLTGDVDELTIVGDMSDFALPGDAGFEDIVPMDWAWFFDPMATPGRRFKITSVEPTQDGVKFSAVDDDPQYYASETNPYLYTPPRDGALLAGVVFSIGFTESLVNVQADISDVRMGWVLSRSMDSEIVVSVNGAARPSVRMTDRSLTVQAQTGDVVTLTVTPVSSAGRGQPLTQSYTVQGLTAPLPELTGLTSVFRDGLTVLVWDRVVDIRQPVYEIRMGQSWANSRLVAITASLETLAVGNGLYWVAARFAYKGAPVYGPADSLQISGATLTRNVILVQDEAPAWSGTVSGGAMVYNGQLTLAPQGDLFDSPDLLAERDLLWFGGPALSGVYTNAEVEQVDIGYVTPVRVDFDIDVAAYNMSADLLAEPDLFAVADLLGGSDLQAISARPQIRHAQEAGNWTPWRDYVPGLVNARYFDVRLVLETSDPLIVPFISKFEWTVDVPDLVQRDEGVLVPAGGLQIDYEKHFHAVPNVQITILDAEDGDQAVLGGPDETGFFVSIINGAGYVERSINWISQGY